MIHGNHPWICPACGHFVVRADQVACRLCDARPQMIGYTGSEQAIAIRHSAAAARLPPTRERSY